MGIERQEQRRHPRYRVDLPATFVSDRTSGLMKIGNLAAGGCGVESNVPVDSGMICQLLMDLPGTRGPLKVSQASVRWVKGHACGIEFLRLDQEEQGCLTHLIGQLKADGMEERLTN